MIRTGLGIFFCMLMLSAGCDTSPKEIPVAVVNISQVFQESDAARTGMNYLENIGDEMQKNFFILQQELESDPENMEKQKKLNEALEEIQGRLNAEQQQVLTRINDAFQQSVDAYRKNKNIAIILRSDQVISMADKFDITNEIIEEMNKIEFGFTPILPDREGVLPNENDGVPTREEKNAENDKK